MLASETGMALQVFWRATHTTGAALVWHQPLAQPIKTNSLQPSTISIDTVVLSCDMQLWPCLAVASVAIISYMLRYTLYTH